MSEEENVSESSLGVLGVRISYRMRTDLQEYTYTLMVVKGGWMGTTVKFDLC